MENLDWGKLALILLFLGSCFLLFTSSAYGIQRKINELRADRKVLAVEEAEAKYNEAMDKAYSSTPTCPWCRQRTYKYKTTRWEEHETHSILHCGNCKGTSLWEFHMCLIMIRPLNPPEPEVEGQIRVLNNQTIPLPGNSDPNLAYHPV